MISIIVRLPDCYAAFGIRIVIAEGLRWCEVTVRPAITGGSKVNIRGRSVRKLIRLITNN